MRPIRDSESFEDYLVFVCATLNIGTARITQAGRVEALATAYEHTHGAFVMQDRRAKDLDTELGAARRVIEILSQRPAGFGYRARKNCTRHEPREDVSAACLWRDTQDASLYVDHELKVCKHCAAVYAPEFQPEEKP